MGHKEEKVKPVAAKKLSNSERWYHGKKGAVTRTQYGTQSGFDLRLSRGFRKAMFSVLCKRDNMPSLDQILAATGA
jgi:hypothetical protein